MITIITMISSAVILSAGSLSFLTPQRQADRKLEGGGMTTEG